MYMEEQVRNVKLLFVTNKRQNGGTNLAQILCGTSHGPREGKWIVNIS